MVMGRGGCEVVVCTCVYMCVHVSVYAQWRIEPMLFISYLSMSVNDVCQQVQCVCHSVFCLVFSNWSLRKLWKGKDKAAFRIRYLRIYDNMYHVTKWTLNRGGGQGSTITLPPEEEQRATQNGWYKLSFKDPCFYICISYVIWCQLMSQYRLNSSHPLRSMVSSNIYHRLWTS